MPGTNTKQFPKGFATLFPFYPGHSTLDYFFGHNCVIPIGDLITYV